MTGQSGSAAGGIQPNYNRPMNAREWTLLFIVAFLWGSAFLFVAVAVKAFPPLTLGAIRLVLGGSLLMVLLYATGGRIIFTRKVIGWYFAVASVNSLVPIYLTSWAQQYITVGVTAILNGAVPLATLFAAHLLTREEKLTGPKLAGTLVGLAGIIFIVGPDALRGFDRNLTAQIAAIVATIFFGFGTVFGRRFRALGVAPLAATAGTLMTSGLMFLPLAIAIDQPWNLPAPDRFALASALAAGLFSTATAHFLFYRLLSTAGATNASLVTLISVPTAILLGALVLGEVLELRHFIGMAIVAIGLAIVDGRPLAALARRLRRN